MFVRHVSMNLKPGSLAEFVRMTEKEIIPLLRKRKGFQDLITFVTPEGTEAVGISLWDQKENAEAYHFETYPEVLKALAKWWREFLSLRPLRLPARLSTRSRLGAQEREASFFFARG